jgi:sterol desaturase/sphingolipid hydroxylase (fatty acid hydroxylase superfamily)
MDILTQLQQQIVPTAVSLLKLCIWLGLLFVVFVPLERRFALHPRKGLRSTFGLDVAYYFLSGVLPKLLLILPLTLLTAALHRLSPNAFYDWVGTLPTIARVAAAMVVGEVGAYWGHRWSHESTFLWRFHAIHHGAEEIDWLVNSRAHPVDMVFTRICSMVPMYLLGLAQPMGNTLDFVPALVTVLGTFWGFFIHANVSWRLGPLEWLISTPAFHHWHHTNDGPERINKNYAPMLPWIDKCFGTLYLPKASWPEKYGTDTPLAPGLAGQLLDPIKVTE